MQRLKLVCDEAVEVTKYMVRSWIENTDRHDVYDFLHDLVLVVLLVGGLALAGVSWLHMLGAVQL